MNSLDYFISYIFPILILVLGLVGNYFGYKTIQRPKMLEIGPRNIYKYLFISDTIFLVQIIVTCLQFSFNTDLTILSNVLCKLWYYLNYSLDTQSSMLLVYISIDRYVSIKLPAQRFFMRKRNNQLIYFVFVFMFNLIYYLPVTYNYKISEINNTLTCDFNNQYSQHLISYMDLANRIILPTFLIMLFSTLLGTEVIKSKRRILSNFKKEENDFYFKEISIAITLILLNLVYLSLQIPISIYPLFQDYTLMDGYLIAYYLLYLSYSINFYVILLTNSLFRSEFILYLKGLNK